MRTAGTGDGGGLRMLRGLTAVVALYALVMQAFLGGIASLAVASPFDLPFAVHCLDKSDAAGPATPDAPVQHQHHACCCTAAHLAAGTPPPLPAIAAIVWPPRLVVRLVWRMEGIASARAPPGTLASARAPPVV